MRRESYETRPTTGSVPLFGVCAFSYVTAIPRHPRTLDCGDIPHRDLPVIGSLSLELGHFLSRELRCGISGLAFSFLFE